MANKVCSKCGLEKDISFFRSSKKNLDGFFRWCEDNLKKLDQINWE